MHKIESFFALIYHDSIKHRQTKERKVNLVLDELDYESITAINLLYKQLNSTRAIAIVRGYAHIKNN